MKPKHTASPAPAASPCPFHGTLCEYVPMAQSAVEMAEELKLLREEVYHLGYSRALALDRQRELQAENNTLRFQNELLVREARHLSGTGRARP